MSVPGEQPTPRRDVTRNRAKLLRAADEVLKADGEDATIEAIAGRAGLGVGTAYRHFANKQALLQALFATRIEGILELADRAAGMADPGDAFEWFLVEAAARQAADRGLRDAISPSDRFDALNERREQLAARADLLVRRAKEAGAIRPDFEGSDLPVLFRIVGAVADYAAEVDPELWRRYLAMLLDGIRPPAVERATLPGQALQPEQVAATIRRHHDRGRCMGTIGPPRSGEAPS